MVRKPHLDIIPFYNPLEFGATSICIGHDFLGGTAKDDISLFMLSLVSQGFITWEQLNIIIPEFRSRLKLKDYDNYPGKVNLKAANGYRLSGNMLQMANMYRFLPVMLYGKSHRYT